MSNYTDFFPQGSSSASTGGVYPDPGTILGGAITTSTGTIITFPTTAGKRYIVHTLRVASSSAPSGDVSVEVSVVYAADGSDIGWSAAVPFPIGSANDLLVKPKVCNPGDAVKIKASSAGLTYIMSYSTVDDVKWVGVGKDLTVGGTVVDVFASPSAGNGTIIDSILVINDDDASDGSDTGNLQLLWTNASNAVQASLLDTYVVPFGATIELVHGSFFLPAGHKIRASAVQGARMELTLAGRNK
jgi:hypothetical protein